MTPEDKAALIEVYDGLRQTANSAIESMEQTVEFVEVSLEGKSDLVDYVERNLGSLPQVQKVVEANRQLQGFDAQMVQNLKNNLNYLRLVKQFFDGFSFDED